MLIIQLKIFIIHTSNWKIVKFLKSNIGIFKGNASSVKALLCFWLDKTLKNEITVVVQWFYGESFIIENDKERCYTCLGNKKNIFDSLFTTLQ